MLKRLEKGVLIALEGIDGAGKTTQARRLFEVLSGMGYDVVRTKEPTDGTWGRKLRESSKTGRLAPEQELELFLKDRREHVSQLITPGLEAGRIILVDRYYFSTVAYQGARGLPTDNLLKANEAFAPPPDVLFLLDISPEEAMRRIHQRGELGNLFEEESSLRAVAKVFAAMNFPYLERLNGMDPPEQVTRRMLDRLFGGVLSTRTLQDGAEVLPKGKDELSNDAVWAALGRVGKR
ncbi:dTMP kinase [Corallococcus exiguus]|uniref:Thymidylate kinase n=1 Tax=Corallococcus exiguus TaxID=83462 RepID=A0A7X4Y3U2_9BACT|nr:dTMP kinase [Corallococcus exiguus]NBC38195.1 dTMP kinase [Corallococcus exiguus]